MSKIAIDVVLLPDEAMTNTSVEVSKKHSGHNGGKIVLHKDNCLPHITLAMGVIDENDVQKAGDVLDKIAKLFPIFNLTTASYKSEPISTGEICSVFTIENTSALQSLHEKIMDNLEPFLSYTVSTDMLYSPPPVEPISTSWVQYFRKDSSYKKYQPHITLAIGKINYLGTPIAFTASRLVLCHLGNYCTCRKILHAVNLPK